METQTLLASDLRRIWQRAHTESASLREVNGVLVQTGFGLRLLELRNISKREMAFEWSVKEYREVRKALAAVDQAIVGSFHSHVTPTTIPSVGDIKYAAPGELYLIVVGSVRQASLWRIPARRSRVSEKEAGRRFSQRDAKSVHIELV